MSTVGKQNPTQYCMESVRKYDYENYLCTLLLPKNLRAAAFAIRAFNVEIAVIQDQTSEIAISGMRYNFWNDTLKKIYNNTPPEAPVPLELTRVLRNHKLSKHYFQRLLDARWKKWQTVSFNDISAIEQYSEDTVSPVNYLLLQTRGIQNVHIDHVASHLGKAQGIVTTIRSVPYHARRRTMILPKNLLIDHGVSSESVFRGESSKELCDVIFALASRANQHLKKARSLKNNFKENVADIFLPAVNVDRYLTKLQRVDFNIYSPKLHRRENMLPFHLLLAKMISKW
ncbi:hypothetical protein PV328_005852 [Microctonus aethiopoides]|uniref:15-cis-phytoene synthase n=1 Tax=Microctonus aethiopoides TaxID=144406 RepID=A0AA39FNB5_9HYME|nr:hypothetical protein PV328_005852 [Microctonus aethiopoides]